jgi:hypothetical protein
MLKKKSENVRLRYCDGKDKYLHPTGVKDVEKKILMRYGYPPDLAKMEADKVLKQGEALAEMFSS